MAKVSIIIPIYNVEDYLEHCIKGILNQTFKDFELILVNDGSPDNSGQICDYYKKRDTRIKVVHKKNQGPGAARNSGLEIATGNYIYFCDPDDIVSPSLLSENVLLAEKNDANLVVFGYHNVFKSGNKEKKTLLRAENKFLKTKKEFRDEFEGLFKTNIMYTLWNKLYKKKFLDEYGYRFSDNKVGEDTIFNYSVYRNLSRVLINQEAYYYYIRNRNGSATNIYRNDRFDLRFNETKHLEELIDFWNYNDKYRDLIINDWITTLYVGISNLTYKKCPLTRKEKIKEVNKMVNIPNINKIVKDYSFKKIYTNNRKILIAAVRNRLFGFSLSILKIFEVLKSLR